jgi:hypothetical protein
MAKGRLALEREFGGAVERLDKSRLAADFEELTYALRRSTASWHFVESAISRMKVDHSISESEELSLVYSLRYAARADRDGLGLSRRILTGTIEGRRLLTFVARNAPAIAPRLQRGGIPREDAYILRAAGLRDTEILEVAERGVSEYCTEVLRERAVDLSASRFLSLDRILRHLEDAGPKEWRRDILHGKSWWKIFWDSVIILTGGVTVGADLLGVTVTAGTTLISVAGGIGMAAAGAREVESDYREAVGAKSSLVPQRDT